MKHMPDFKWVHVAPTLAHIKGPELDEDGKEWWTNLASYDVEFWFGNLLIPEGFRHDGASVPRFFWRLFPPLSTYAVAAIVHDWFYRWRGKVRIQLYPGGDVITMRATRKQADQVFLNLMTELGLPRWRRRTMHLAVRIGGPRW